MNDHLLTSLIVLAILAVLGALIGLAVLFGPVACVVGVVAGFLTIVYLTILDAIREDT